jgi:hypothetical protein
MMAQAGDTWQIKVPRVEGPKQYVGPKSWFS